MSKEPKYNSNFKSNIKSIKAAARNRQVKKKIKTFISKLYHQVESYKKDKSDSNKAFVKDLMIKVESVIMKARNDVLKNNTASRKVSRIAQYVNSALGGDLQNRV